jgi:hypothetical protein
MNRNVKLSRTARQAKPRKTVARSRARTDHAAEGALTLWRTVHDRLLLEKVNTHLQGLYAELGKLYFEHLEKVPRLPVRKRPEAEELTARIAEFRRQRSRLELRKGAAPVSEQPASRGQAGRRPARRP